MKIEFINDNGGHWRIGIEPGELFTKAGKPIMSGGWIGTVRERKGKIKLDVWKPAQAQVRGYKEAATMMVNHAANMLREHYTPGSPSERSALVAFRSVRS